MTTMHLLLALPGIAVLYLFVNVSLPHKQVGFILNGQGTGYFLFISLFPYRTWQTENTQIFAKKMNMFFSKKNINTTYYKIDFLSFTLF